jgi:hypothetical protein
MRMWVHFAGLERPVEVAEEVWNLVQPWQAVDSPEVVAELSWVCHR